MDKAALSAFSKRWSLEGKTALITGGSRGIGKGIAEELLAFGGSVYICARSQEGIDKCLAEWEKNGFEGKVAGSTCDVTVPEDRVTVVKKAVAFFRGKLDIMVNNAACGMVKAAIDHTLDDVSSVLNGGYQASFHFSQLSYPYLKASGSGNVIFVSSVSSLTRFVNTVAYSSSKAALNHLAKVLACEWAKDGIRTNCISPGMIITPASESVLGIPEFVKEYNTRTPAARIGTVQECASAAVFLCLPAASYITGHNLVLDGGLSANGFHVPFLDQNVHSIHSGFDYTVT